jgi:CHAT domain-containing protein
LYDLLLAPIISSGASSLLIVPDGFISFIPFDALLTSLPKTTGMASFPFLIKQAEITNAFSCKTILVQQQIKNNIANNSILAFAPGFINKERGFAPLLHSTEELQMIKEFYPAGKYFINNTATLQQFKNNYADAAIIHLATHANAGSDSAIVGIEFYDSTLYLNTVYTMPLKAKLVVLSGCETGTGNINKAEGLMSLARGFSYAGTKNVVAGLWQTEDKTSGELFKSFYGNLEGNSISGSLQKAKLQLLQNASVSQASPFYWAGYIYIGNPQEKLNEKQGNSKTITFILGALILVGISLIVKRRKKSVG